MSDTTSGQDHLLPAILPTRTSSPTKQGNLPHHGWCNLLWTCKSKMSCQCSKIYFIIKGPKSVYGREQLDTHSQQLCSHEYPYDQESTWKWHAYQQQQGPINFNYFLNERVLSFTTPSHQQARKRTQTDRKFTPNRRGNEPQNQEALHCFSTEDRTGRWQSKRTDLLSEYSCQCHPITIPRTISTNCRTLSKWFISDFLYLDPTMEGLQEPRKGICHPNSYQIFKVWFYCSSQTLSYKGQNNTGMNRTRRTSIQFGCTLHTRLDTSTLQWRPFCFHTQTPNWRHSERSKWELQSLMMNCIKQPDTRLKGWTAKVVSEEKIFRNPPIRNKTLYYSLLILSMVLLKNSRFKLI